VGGRNEKCIKDLLGKDQRRETLRRTIYRWKDNREIELKILRCKNAGYIHLAQDIIQWRAHVDMVRNLGVP
jgi:hypothetical protein